MSLCQWNTSFEHKQLAKLTTSLALYQTNTGVSQTGEEMMSESLSSSGTSSLSSSSSASLASEMDLDQALDIDPVHLKLIYTTTTLNEKINSTILDGGISWGCTLTILDLSESDAVENCHLHKVDLQTLTEKLWPLMSAHLSGDQNKIMCVNQYTIKYECEIVILLYCLSHPRRLRHNMEKNFGIRRSCLSAIIQTFSEALYKVATPYLNNPSI